MSVKCVTKPRTFHIAMDLARFCVCMSTVITAVSCVNSMVTEQCSLVNVVATVT